MTHSWIITGISRSRPRSRDFYGYDGEDVYHSKQSTRGQINECLVQFAGKPILLVAIDPTGCETVEELAQEVKESIVWGMKGRSEDDPVLKVLRGEKE